MSRELSRRVGVLVDRRGTVTHVFLGDAKTIEVPPLRRFRLGERLKGLRWITTLLRGEEPTRDDLNTLVRWRLDLLVLVGVDSEGQASFVREVWIILLPWGIPY